MNTYFRKLGAGFSGLLQFNGRTALHDFWPYAITIFCVFYGLTSLGGMWIGFNVAGDVYEFARENPDAVIERRWPGGFEYRVEGMPIDIYPYFRTILFVSLIGAAVAAVLLLAAIVRRLHDTGKSGFWSLIPVPFGAYGIFTTDQLFARFLTVETFPSDTFPIQPFIAEFMLGMISNLLWLASLIVLIIMLCGRGTPGPNRFGPQPVRIQG